MRVVRRIFFVASMVFMLALQVLFMNGLAFGQGRYDAIVTGGQFAPDGNGTFSLFTSPVLNNSGVVGTNALLVGTSGGMTDSYGIFTGSGGPMTQVARGGQTAPDGNGMYSIMVFGLHLNDSGTSVFRSVLTNTSGGPNDDHGVFSSSAGVQSQIVREGQTAPDGNGTFSTIFNVTINNLGTSMFRSDLIGTSGGSSDNVGLYTSNNGIISQIMRRGQIAPDGNGTFSDAYSTSLNDMGAVSFIGTLTGTSGGTSDDQGIFTSRGGSISQIVREGQTVPDGNGSFGSFGFSGLSTNNSGTSVFFSYLTGTIGGLTDNNGIFRASDGSITQIVRAGHATPDGNGVFNFLGDPALNESGTAAFYGRLTGTSGGSTDNSGIFTGNGVTIKQIVRRGQGAPDGNGFFDELETRQAINNSGAVAFTGSMNATSNGTDDDSGLFLGDGEELFQIAREGDILGGSPITDLDFAPGLYFGKVASGLNDHGQVAYVATVSTGRAYVQLFTPDLHWRRSWGSLWDTSANWTLGLTPGNPHDVFIDPSGSLAVVGPEHDTTVRSLQIGGGTGIATLQLQRGAMLTATNGVTINPTGVLTGDGIISGNVNNYGTIIADNVTIGDINQGIFTLTNYGLVTGSGRINAGISNDVSGQFRVGPGERMVVTSSFFDNQGTMEIVGGEIELLTYEATSSGEINVIDGTFRTMDAFFNSADTGLISGSDARMHFEGGLVNYGGLGFTAGTSHVFGDVGNYDNGMINISTGHVTFYDDLDQNGTMIVASVGQTNSVAVLFGEFSGAGGFIGGGDVYSFGDMRIGNSPASVLMDGNLFLGGTSDMYVELAGMGLGMFDQMIVTGDLGLGGELFVDLIDGFRLTFNDEFLIADVGGSLGGQFLGLNEGDLVGNFGGMDLFISYSAGDGNDISLFTPIPEPRLFSVCIIALALGMAFHVRKRDSSPRAASH